MPVRIRKRRSQNAKSVADDQWRSFASLCNALDLSPMPATDGFIFKLLVGNKLQTLISTHHGR